MGVSVTRGGSDDDQRQSVSQTDGQKRRDNETTTTHRQTHRQTDTQTDRQTDRHRQTTHLTIGLGPHFDLVHCLCLGRIAILAHEDELVGDVL